MTDDMRMVLKSILSSLLLVVLLIGQWPQVQARELPDFTELVEMSHKAVVNISTTKNTESHASEPGGDSAPGLEDSPLSDLFRKFFGEQQPFPEDDDSTSLGSGFIISSDGYVLTNHHVIEDADSIIVRLYDRREFVAKLVGSDESSDMALLRIEGTDLPTARLGNSHDLKVGAWVLAIGSPFGFEHSVTAGIVSAKGRALPNENYVPFIQTDVAINPGNSGGPLFDLDGDVVGINSQIYSRTGGFMGLSFAIPIEVAMDVVEQLKVSGKVARGWLGVVIQEVTRELAESFGMSRAYGALVSRVLPGSPAEKSAIQAGDVIVAYNGETVQRSTDLPPLVGRSRIGDIARVEIIRNGQTRTLRVEIGDLAAFEVEAESKVPSMPEPAKNSILGLSVEELDEQARSLLDLKQGGVLVTQVENGPASKAGVRQGDAIISLDNKPVDSVAEFSKIVAALGAKRSVAVLVQRPEGPLFLALQLDAGTHGN